MGLSCAVPISNPFASLSRVYLHGKTPANRGGVKIPAMKALNVVAFGTWVKDVKRRGQAVEAILFTNKVLEIFKEKLDRPNMDATAVVSPGAYKDSTSWGQYNLSVSNFLSTIRVYPMFLCRT